MDTRRSPGEGSIYQRKDGKYVAQYRIETIAGSKKKYLYCSSEKEAKQRLRAALAEVEASGIIPDAGKLTVGSYLDQWLDGTKPTIKDSGWKRYEQSVRLHIKPAVGSVKLSKLSALHVQKLYSAKLADGLSPRSVQIIHATLHKALKQAVLFSLVPVNVAERVESPSYKQREINPLNRGQIAALLDAAKGDRLEALYVLAVTTGMREGELLALRYEDVDTEAGTVHIRRSIHAGVLSEPKTKSSRRTIQLTRHAVDALRQHREKSTGEGFVFCTNTGNPIRAQNLINRSWKKLLEKAGIPYRNFHQLRHTVATQLLEQDVNPLLVSQLLGHADVAFTLRVYTHPNDQARAKTARAMEDVLG